MPLKTRNRFTALSSKPDINPGTAASLEILGVPNNKEEGEEKIKVNESEKNKSLIDTAINNNANDTGSLPEEEIINSSSEPKQIKEILKKTKKVKNDPKVLDEDSKLATTHISKGLLKTAKVAILNFDLEQTLQEFTEDAIKHYIRFLEKRKN